MGLSAAVFVPLFCLLILLCCSVESVRVKSQQLVRPYRKDVCEPNARAYDPKIVCYCDNISENEMYSKADCWVYGSDLAEDDVAWEGFGRNTDIKELSIIVYTNSSLTFLPQKALYYLNNLSKLSISYGDISTINSYEFTKFRHLESISLITNQITSLQDFAFAKLGNLRSLNASFNQITFIDRHVFYQNFNQQLLQMTANNISEIAEGAFADLGNLVELRLDHNYLRRLPKRVFEGLVSIKQLILTGNYITMIDDDTFEYITTVEILELDQNSIAFIGPNSFTLLTNLRRLNLEHNELKHLVPGTFRSLTNLNHLNVGKNSLRTFQEDKDLLLRNQFLNETSELIIYDNNLQCDCRLLWLFDVRNRTRSGQVQKMLDILSCELEDPIGSKAEPVFLLRLHYENFVCDDEPPTTPNIFDFTRYRETEVFFETSEGTCRTVSLLSFALSILLLIRF